MRQIYLIQIYSTSLVFRYLSTKYVVYLTLHVSTNTNTQVTETLSRTGALKHQKCMVTVKQGLFYAWMLLFHIKIKHYVSIFARMCSYCILVLKNQDVVSDLTRTFCSGRRRRKFCLTPESHTNLFLLWSHFVIISA